MKKNLLFRLCAATLAVVLLACSLSSCAIRVKDMGFYFDNSYYDDIVFTDKTGKKVTSFSGSDGDYFDINFDAPQTVDTLVLKEKGDNITDYEILVKQNDEFQSIYKQDLVGSFRYCAFENVTTDTIRLVINKTSGGSFRLGYIDALNSRHTDNDFRVTSYVIADRVYDINSLDREHFNVITDAVLFGAVTFNENGELEFNSFELNGETLDGRAVLSKAIENIRSVSGDGVKLYINILGPSGENDNEKQQLHTDCFNNNADTLIANINALISEFSVDGIYFDYEYPYASKHMTAYSKFLVKLNDGMPEDKKIGVALGPWGKVLSDKAKKAVDYIEVMSYDMFDKNGFHSTFASKGGAFALDYFNSKGYDVSKCDLGVPFYGRPVNKDAYWFDYNSCCQSLGKFGNIDSGSVKADNDNPDYTVDRYYNSYQMVFDKTAFAYDYGTGGMMVWHYSCDAATDTGLSLFDAMAKAIQSRQN